MNRLLIFILVIVVLFGPALAGADNSGKIEPPFKEEYLSNLNKGWGFTLKGERGLKISGYFYTKEVLKQFYGIEWIEKREKLLNRRRVLRVRWPERIPIRIGIGSLGGVFRIRHLTFTQGGEKYELEGFTDVYNFAGDFRSGRIPRGVKKDIFVAVPEGIDLDRPFELHYEKEVARLNPQDLDAD